MALDRLLEGRDRRCLQCRADGSRCSPASASVLHGQLRRFAAVCSFAGGYNLLDGPALIGNRPLGARTQSTRRKRMRLEVRRANLDDDLRHLFEQYGEQVVAMALALGSNQGTGLRTHPVAPTHAMSVVHANQDAAASWLLERRDLAERRETIGMIINAALLVFIALSILLGVINLFRGLH
jgi:hypothetical protein